MIRIAGIELPETAVWENEMEYGAPLAKTEICANGSEVIFTGGRSGKIDIYVPKVAGELTRDKVLALKALADAGGTFSLTLGAKQTQAQFRYEDGALELKPVSPKQTQADTDSYYGTIRLLEV